MLISLLKKYTTPQNIHVVTLLNIHGQKQLIFKNVCLRTMFCALLQNALCNYSVDFVVLIKALFMLKHTKYI